MAILIITSLFMCAFIAIFLNPNLDNAAKKPSAKIAGDHFSNPNGDAVTKNGGGWALRFTSVGGPRLPLTDLVVALKTPVTGGTSSQEWFFKIEGPGNNSADLLYQGSTLRWALKAYNTTSVPLRYANGTVAVPLNGSTAKYLREDQFSSVEGALILFSDADLNGNLSIDDKITIYKDVNADGTAELTSGTLLELQTLDGKLVSSAILK